MSFHHNNINQILSELECEIREKPVSKKQDIPEDLCNVKDESIEAPQQPDTEQLEQQVQQTQQQAQNNERKTQQCIEALSQLTQQTNTDSENMQHAESVESKMQEVLDNYQIIHYYFEELYRRFRKVLDREEDQDLSITFLIDRLSDVEEINLDTEFLRDFTSIKTFEALNNRISGAINGNFNTLNQNISQFTNKVVASLDTTSTLNGVKFSLEMVPYIKRLETVRNKPEPVDTGDNISTDNIDSQGTELNIDKRSNVTEREISIDFTADSFENGDVSRVFENISNYEFVDQNEDEVISSGTLYSELYNRLEDPVNQLFSPAERGLSQNKNDVDESVAGTEASTITLNDQQFFIADIEQYNRFFNNTETKIKNRIQQIREDVINPGFENLKSIFDTIINLQIKQYIIYGITWDTESRLEGILEDLKTNYEHHRANYQALVDKIEQAAQAKQQSRQNIDSLPERINQIECFKQPPEPEPPQDAGSNPKGAFATVTLEDSEPQLNNMPDPNKPQPTQLCYWEKVADLANTINLLPYPDRDRGGIRYWPIGLTIAGPNGPIKIPMPVKWNPVTVISSAMGIMVFFINQTGILPSPFLMIIDSQNASQFLISMRGPGDSFGGEDYLEEIPEQIRNNFGIGDSVFKQAIQLPTPNIDADSLGAINSGDSISNLLQDISRDMSQAIEKAGLPDLPQINNVKSDMGESANDLPNDEKISLIQSDIQSYVNSINLPQIKVPQDESKLEPKLSNPEKILSEFQDFITFNFQVDSDLNLKTKAINQLDSIDLNTDIDLSNLPNNIEINSANLVLLTQVWKQFTNIITDRIKSEDKLQITNQNISELTEGVQISATDCGLEDVDIDNDLNPRIIVQINVLNTAINSIIDNITPAIITTFIGTSQIEIGSIKDLFKELIRDQLPNISLPSDLLNFDFPQIFSNKISTALENPQIKLPYSVVGAPSFLLRKIPIDLNLLKSPLAEQVSNTIANTIDQDTLDNFYSNTQTDFKVLFRDTIINGLESIVTSSQLITSTYQLLSNIPSVTGVNLDIPKAIKINNDSSQKERAKFALEYAQSLLMNITDVISFKDTTESLNALEQLQNTDLLSYITTTAAAAAGSEAVAPIIAVHPALNYENLPPWERLSLDNFLFVLYLDKLCNNCKIKGGFFENP